MPYGGGVSFKAITFAHRYTQAPLRRRLDAASAAVALPLPRRASIKRTDVIAPLFRTLGSKEGKWVSRCLLSSLSGAVHHMACRANSAQGRLKDGDRDQPNGRRLHPTNGVEDG